MAAPAPPIHFEARTALELRALITSRAWRGVGIPRGDERPVLLIPGFMAGDGSLRLMAGWLKRMGYRPSTAGIRSNVQCSERALAGLERRLEDIVERAGERPATIVGHSRGGMFGRVLAVRRPDLVDGLVTLGTPHVATLDDLHPLLQRQIDALCRLGDAGRPFISSRCRVGAFGIDETHPDGGCCERFWQDMAAPPPPGVGFASVYSKTDGVVRWTACLDPAAEHIEVSSSHCGMALNPRVYRLVAGCLHRFAHDVPERAPSNVRALTPLALSPLTFSTGLAA